MSIIMYLVTLGAIASSSSAANLTVASSTDEFVAAWQRKFQNDINIADLKIECVDSRGAESIKLMKDQQEEILKEIRRNEESLVPVQSLSLIRRHCVQKHQSSLVTYESATAQFAVCNAAAQSRVNSLTVSAKNALSGAKTSANVNLPRAIVSCNTTHFSNPTKLEECVISTVDSYANSIKAYLISVDKNLDASLCTTTDLSRDAIKCSFATEKNIMMTIGKVSILIDSCINETESVCPCAKNLMVGNDTTTAPSLRNIVMGAKV